MSVLVVKPLLPEFIKLRWLEPYVSSAMNRKTFKSLPRGFYNGFVVRPGPAAKSVTVRSDDPAGWGLTSGYAQGNFDSASGWSVAVHASVSGFTSTVIIPNGPNGNFEFDLSAYSGQDVFLALDVQYQEGFPTEGQIKAVQALDLDTYRDLMVVAKVQVPMAGSIADGNIIYDDAAYPRVLPFANRYKYGFMSALQAELLELITSDAVSGAPIFDEEVLITVDGAQDVSLPGGYTYVVGSRDLLVWKNTGIMRVGASRDYIEVDRGDGFGDHVTWVGANLKAGDRIRFRVQKYAVGLNSTLTVMDEGSVIEHNAVFVNFKGSGVTVLPDGYRRVKVVIPGGGGGAAATRTKLNFSGLQINQYAAVHLLPGNTIVACDPRVSGHKLFGVAVQNIPHGSYGDIQVAGVIEGAGTAVSGSAVNSDVFVSHLGDGSLTTVPPDPVSGTVLRVGIADGPDGVSGGVPTDIVFDRGRLA